MMNIALKLPDPARFWLALPLLMALLFAVSPAPASAQSLDSYRAKGQIGERYDGYVMATQKKPSSKIKKVVRSVNSKRRSIYNKRAKQQRVSPAQVGRVYARTVLSKVPRGTYFLKENGKWVRK